MALINSQTGAAASFLRPSGVPEHREEAMSLKEYDVEINGHKTTVQFSDEDAAMRGLDPDSDSNEARAALELQALADTLAAEEEAKARAEAERAAAAEKERAEAAEKAKEEAEKAAEPKAARRPANKAAPAPENKAG